MNHYEATEVDLFTESKTDKFQQFLEQSKYIELNSSH